MPTLNSQLSFTSTFCSSVPISTQKHCITQWCGRGGFQDHESRVLGYLSLVLRTRYSEVSFKKKLQPAIDSGRPIEVFGLSPSMRASLFHTKHAKLRGFRKPDEASIYTRNHRSYQQVLSRHCGETLVESLAICEN
jgi:hypothetical protein